MIGEHGGKAMNAPLAPPELLTLREAAQALNVSVDTLNRERASGRLQVTRIRNRVFISIEQLDDYVRSCAVSAPQ